MYLEESMFGVDSIYVNPSIPTYSDIYIHMHVEVVNSIYINLLSNSCIFKFDCQNISLDLFLWLSVYNLTIEAIVYWGIYESQVTTLPHNKSSNAESAYKHANK